MIAPVHHRPRRRLVVQPAPRRVANGFARVLGTLATVVSLTGLLVPVSLSVLLTALLVPSRSAAQPPSLVDAMPPGGAADVLEGDARRALVEAERHPAMRWGELGDVRVSLTALYDASAWSARWLHNGEPTDQALSFITEITGAAAVGLIPADFDAGRLASLATTLHTPAHRAAFDVAMSANALRFVRSIREGRIDPRQAHAALNLPRAPFDVVAAVDTLTRAASVGAALRAHEPTYTHYALTKQALVRLRALAAEQVREPLPPLPGGASLREGAAWEGVPALRRLLAAVGDLADAPISPDDSLAYSGDVVQALANYQRRTGLEPDGIIGRATLAQLSRPLTDKVRTLELALERWRWLPREIGAPPIIVNIPAYRLYAFRSGSDDEGDLLSMDVVVGQSFDWRTPIFTDTLTTVVFAPFWEVPNSIARQEIVPKARADAAYLARNRYQIVRGERDDAPAMDVTPENLAAVAAGRLRIRQLPGPGNAMGRVKFLFPNAFNVYFHDTPAQAAFNRARRDVSHGCVRVAMPVDLAELVLSDDPAWDRERILAAMARATPQTVRLRTPRPVFLLYATAMTTQDGETRFYPDIYGYDDQLAELLARGFPYGADTHTGASPGARP